MQSVMIAQPPLPEPQRLSYTIHACSSYSGQYGPENILVDDPSDQRSRWSGGSGFTSFSGALGLATGRPGSSAGTNTAAGAAAATLPSVGTSRERQWLILKVSEPAVLRSITFGKYNRSHPCNVKEFKIYAGLEPEVKSMSMIFWGGLKNDTAAETFEVVCANRQGILRPTRYVCIEPLSAHSSNYNISIWHISLAGNAGHSFMSSVSRKYNEFCEDYTSKLLLKHLRQKGQLAAFDALLAGMPSTSSFKLEHPAVTNLHHLLVQQGDFEAVEDLLASMARPADSEGESGGSSLFDAFCQAASPQVRWLRLDTLPGTANWDGEAPSARGGHQMVQVHKASELPQDMSRLDPSYLYLHGGWDGTAELADLWRFNLHDERWELLSSDASAEEAISAAEGTPVPGPKARSCHQMAVHESTGDIYMLGGFVEARSNVEQYESLEPQSGARPQSGSGDTNRSASPPASTYRGESFEWESSEGTPIRPSEFWVLHTRNGSRGTWELLSRDVQVNGGPRLIFDHQMAIDPVTNTLFVFGGKHYGSGGAPGFSGLYSYDIQAKTWKHLTSDVDPFSMDWTRPPARCIPSRSGHSMLCDTAGRRLLILAGQRSDQYMSDMWSYSLVDGSITCLEKDYALRGGPDGAFTQRTIIDHGRQKIVLLSGLTKERIPPHFTKVKNTLWIYDLKTQTWSKVDTAVPQAGHTSDHEITDPRPRFAHQFVYDQDSDEFFLFGGNPADATVSKRLDDFWRLSLDRLSKEDVLMRCKFYVRRCKFLEMCEDSAALPSDSSNGESPHVAALLYLQTAVSSVTDSSTQSDFLACMGHLLSARPLPEDGKDTGDFIMGDSAKEFHSRSKEATASHSDILSGADQAKTARWQRRNSVFETILAFLPADQTQPTAELVSCVNAWDLSA